LKGKKAKGQKNYTHQKKCSGKKKSHRVKMKIKKLAHKRKVTKSILAI
jgi:hypothetical protein